MGTAAYDLRHGRAEPAVSADFEAVYEAHFEFVWRALRRLGVDEDATRDAVQDVFLVVHRRLGGFEGRSSLQTWLYGIALRVARDHRRRRARKGGLEPLDREFVDPAASPAEHASRGEAWRILDRILDELGEDKREIFVLAEVGELSVPEIAELLELNLNTAYSRLRAARSAFEAALLRHRLREAERENE